jgi:hypothetical protein
MDVMVLQANRNRTHIGTTNRIAADPSVLRRHGDDPEVGG